MEIVKELNKDDGLEFIKNGSITHASNIVVSKDGNSIQNEKSLETIATFDNTIVGIVPCATELVIFTNANEIFRYNEFTGETIKVAASWEWYGGEVFGTYTYNVRGDLIIAISERNPREDVPLKVINLNNADLGSDNIFTLNPNIPQVTVTDYGQMAGGRMRMGTYLLFIRYEITDNEYTSWRDLGVVIYLSNELSKETVSSVTIEGIKMPAVISKPIHITATYELYDYSREDTDYAQSYIYAKLEMVNKTTNKFKSFQIAYVCTYKDGTEAYNLGSYQFNEENKYDIYGIRSGKTQMSVDEVLVSANNFNLYNIKTMCNYNNRLYVANYKEESRKLDIDSFDTSGIKVGVWNETDNHGNKLKDDSGKETVIGVPKPIEDEVYRFYIHYVYPDGSYTDGILIENNNYRHKDTNNGFWVKDPVQIVIGRYYNTSINKDVDIMMDCYDDTKVSDVKAAIEQAKKDYPGWYGTTIMDKLSLIQMAEEAKIDYYWFNLDPQFMDGSITSASPYYGMKFLCPFTNNKGDRLFRTPHQVKGNFTFKNIPMYEGFVGYFISYEEIDSILICDGIVDQHRDEGFSNDVLRESSFNNLAVYSSSYQFYSDDIYVLKKSGTPNVFVSLGTLSFQTRDEQTANSGDTINAYVVKDCANNSIREYSHVNSSDFYAANSTPQIGITSKIVANNAGQYFKIGIPYSSAGQLISTIILTEGTTTTKLLTRGRLLYINQEIYTKKEGVKLIRLGQNKYIDGEPLPLVGYEYGENGMRQNVTGYISMDSAIIIFDNAGVTYSGDWQPVYGSVDRKFYGIYRTAVGLETTDNAIRDIMHINAVRCYKQLTYLPSAKIKVGKIEDTYFTYARGDADNFANISNRQLTASILYGLYEVSSIYVDYARPNINAYNPNAVANQVEVYGKFIRRSNVLQSESTNNAWRQFPADGYKIISENKGNIINILGTGVYLIAHCEHSMFIFNRDSTLATKDKDVQMYMPDAFDTEYQEVFTSEKGYGGLQDFGAFICNEVGYVFFDKSKRKLYRFDDKQLNDITTGIQSVLDEYVNKNTIVNIGMDKESNRLICSFTGEEKVFTFSYSLAANNWISTHNYSGKYFNTKTELYQISDSTPKVIYKNGSPKINGELLYPYLNYEYCTIDDNKNPFYISEAVGCAVVDVVFNLEFDTIKLLNYITYDLKKTNNINYSGNKILIFTNTGISTEWDVSTTSRNEKNMTKPYYEQGKWNFNYFRSLIKGVEELEPIDRITGNYNIVILDENQVNIITAGKPYKKQDSLINGKYIGIRFIIKETDVAVTLSNIECFINKYRE